MDPFSVLAVASFALNAFGAHKQAQGSKQLGKYQASIAMENAAIAREQGQVAAQAQRRDAQRVMGSMVANYGASGVQVDQGSPVDVLADSARMAELDRLTTLYNSEIQARNYENEATIAKMGGANASTAGMLGVAQAGLDAFALYKRFA